MKHLGSKDTNYKYDKPDKGLLETFENKHPKNLYLIPFVQPFNEFDSLCPATGQPDSASMEIIYIPGVLCVESKSLKLYLMSYRNSGEFHEDVTNRILNDLQTLLKPKYMRIYADFVPRGGLAIKPIATYWPETDDKQLAIYFQLVEQWDRQKKR